MNKKEIAKEFLHLAAKGESRNAFQLYIGENFIHHNAFFKGNGENLMVAMEKAAKNNPHKVLEVQRILEENNLVAVHSWIKQTPDDLGASVIHIFRFKEDKIVELWDVGQAVPVDMVNEHGMF